MKEQILKTIEDFMSYPHSDTVWVTPSQTMFERLVDLYVQAGGELSVLNKKFPEMF